MKQKIFYIISDKEWDNKDIIFNYIKQFERNVILYLKNDYVGNKIKFLCFKQKIRYAYIPKINKEITDNIFEKVPLSNIVIFSKNNSKYDDYIKYCIQKALELKIKILNITENKKFSSCKMKGFKQKKFKINEKIEYKEEYEEYSDDEYEKWKNYRENYKKKCIDENNKKISEKKIKKTKNQKKILKQHSYMKYQEQSEKYKKKITPGQKDLSSFFQKRNSE